MSVELRAWIDSKEIADFDSLRGKVRVAAAIALTKTAKDSQMVLRAQAGAIFHLRNNWVVQGIRIKGANAGNLNAKVGTIDKYMGRHVSGDPKAAAKGLSISSHRDANGRLATGGLLIGLYAGAGDLHRAVRRKLARIDGQKKKTFQIVGRGGNVLIVRRTGKSRKSIEVLAVLKSQVSEKPVWDMEKSVATVVRATFGTHFAAAASFGSGAR